jgi:heptosyltransferase-2
VRPGPQRVLLAAKYRFLGDAVCLTPALRAARRTWPEAHIALLTGPPIRALLQGCPYIDEFILFEPRRREWEPRANIRLVHWLYRRGFEEAILFNRAFHPALVAAFARIPRRIGFDTDYRGWLLTDRVPLGSPCHEIDDALSLLGAAGVPVDVGDRVTELWLREEEREEARTLLVSHGVFLERPLVGVQPGTRLADPATEREWGVARFAQVGDRLARETGAQVILMGSAEERPASERVAALMGQKPLVLTGQTTLREALALISLCRLWIGNDSGLRHVAVALGVATVGILDPTNAARWGYQSDRHRSLVAYPRAPRRDPQTIRQCLDAISPDAVFEAAMAIWGERAGQPARGTDEEWVQRRTRRPSIP